MAGVGAAGKYWKGTPLDRLRRDKWRSMPATRSSTDHEVFFTVEMMMPGGWHNADFIPIPSKYVESWDDTHVHMPCSAQNTISSETASAGEPAWGKILSALKGKIRSVIELKDAIMSYNPDAKTQWNFDALHHYFEAVTQTEKDKFFSQTLPKMQELAISLPFHCKKGIPILKRGVNQKLTFSQNQVACLLANAFFCTFPKRSGTAQNNLLPSINFSKLFSDEHLARKIQKLKCIFNYFDRVTTEGTELRGAVSYTRRCVNDTDMPDWHTLTTEFCDLHASASGTVEDDSKGMLQVDFAASYVGGNVFDQALEQEAICFLIYPEMILSRLFTEALQDNEVLFVTGCERFNDYEGYGDTFMFTESYYDDKERDGWGRRFTEVVAMDALQVQDYKLQFEKKHVLRELKKAFCAFRGNELPDEDLSAVRTGNWGCGNLGGDKHLKALIQLMAASAAGRDVCYITFGDQAFCNELAALHNIFKEDEVQIGRVLQIIEDYYQQLLQNQAQTKSLFHFIATMLGKSLGQSAGDE